jgi:hypothetical protein
MNKDQSHDYFRKEIAEKAKEPVTKITKPTGRSVDELKLSLYKNQI